jgi:enterochelin esterase-like enzyme
MNVSYQTLIILSLFPALGLPAQEEPSWWKAFETFQWINEAPEQMHPSLVHLTFYSEANDTEVGFYMRLPRGYDSPGNKKKSYPVIYYLHGGRPGSEVKGRGGFNNMLPMLKSEDYPPVFIVLVNGGKLSHYEYDEYKGVSAFLELVDYVDKTYPTITDRSGRVVMGSSQGGRGTARYIFKFPELFGTAVSLAGGHQHEKRIHENEGVESEYLTIPDAKNNVFNNALVYAARDNAPEVNLMVVIGNKDANYVGNLEWSIHLQNLNIKHELVVVPGTGHGIDWSIENTDTRIYNFITDSLNHYSNQ